MGSRLSCKQGSTWLHYSFRGDWGLCYTNGVIESIHIQHLRPGMGHLDKQYQIGHGNIAGQYAV